MPTDNVNNSKNCTSNKIKIVFFVKRGLDSFLGDIINKLSEQYETKKIIVTNNNQIDEGMKWADICWFEWCDELVIYGSKSQYVLNKKIICRIHGYEVYTNLIKQVNWRNIDQIIIVAPHIRRIFEESTKGINLENIKIDLVYCGINTNMYPLNIKKKGYNLGYLGFLNFKKNIPLTLDIFKKLHDYDPKYRLYIAGKYQDARTRLYLKYFIKENNLESGFQFEGWKNYKEKIEWFKKIDYMIISSIDEGLCFAAAESMCSGIKPILHNCEGLKDHYDNKYIFNTLDEAVDMIKDEKYDSYEYHKYIQDNYCLENEIEHIKKIVNDLEQTKIKIKSNKNYIDYWNNRYLNNGTSGQGSYGVLADFKAGIINNFIKDNQIKSVIEFGCGDGNQLSKINYNKYIGLDVSIVAIDKCKKKFQHDNSKSFYLYHTGQLENVDFTPDMIVCLDVLYHIVDEDDFVKTLDDIFMLSPQYIILYTILEKPNITLGKHLKYRNIYDYLAKYEGYHIKEIINQKYPEQSLSDFLIIEKCK